MLLFTQLFNELDTTTRTVEKVQALERYFVAAQPRDAAWALYFLVGRKIKRVIKSRLLREWLSIETGLPLWIIDESYHAVGDLAETLALLLPDDLPNATIATTTADLRARPVIQPGMLFSYEELIDEEPAILSDTTAPSDTAHGWSLHRLVEQRVVPLRDVPVEQQRILVVRTWRQLNAAQRFLWHKLILGEFRVGVARTLVARALANVAGIPAEIMAHRLMGPWEPTAEGYADLVHPTSTRTDPGQPYPFFLAHPLEKLPDTLGDVADWQAEWKWDGIRAQLIRRQGEVLVWSRGEDLMTDRFPEVAEIGRALPDGVVLDGEILAWRDDAPLPFATLQRRIGRKTVGDKLRADAPVAFMAYDLLELEGIDLRASPLVERRAKLEALVRQVTSPNTLNSTTACPLKAVGMAPTVPTGNLRLRISPIVECNSWEELIALHADARVQLVEGLMLKRRDSPYGVGRPRGDWWKWKVTPLSIDAVLIYAQQGHGRRASLFTDYTFGVWNNGELVPVAKAYSGLTDTEIQQVDAFVRHNTIDKFGPVRTVKPELVFELHFEGIQISTRHKSGVAVRFPRMHRWRTDKKPADADTLDALKQIAASL